MCREKAFKQLIKNDIEEKHTGFVTFRKGPRTRLHVLIEEIT